MNSCIKNSFNINFTKNLLNNQNYVLWKHIKEKIMKVEKYQNVWKIWILYRLFRYSDMK